MTVEVMATTMDEAIRVLIIVEELMHDGCWASMPSDLKENYIDCLITWGLL